MTGTSIFVKAHERHLAQPDWYFDTVESALEAKWSSTAPVTKGFKDSSKKEISFHAPK